MAQTTSAAEPSRLPRADGPRVPRLADVSRPVTLLLIAVGLTLGVVLGGVLVRDPVTPALPAPVEVAPVALAELDTTTLAVPRAELCTRVPTDAVAAALGGDPTRVVAYGNGDTAVLTADVRDVSHEFGCTFARGPRTVRAWLFAPPVTVRNAEQLVDDAAGPGCRRVVGGAAFGSPSVALRCPTDPAAARRAPARALYEWSYRGLFGDAWLTCTLLARGDDAGAADRADRWCAAVVQVAAG